MYDAAVLLCDINQLFMAMKLSKYLPCPVVCGEGSSANTNKRLYERQGAVNRGVERQCAATRGEGDDRGY